MSDDKIRKNMMEENKYHKENSFMRVRFLLKDELIEVLTLKQMLIGTDVYSPHTIESYDKLKKRNSDNTHYKKILNR